MPRSKLNRTTSKRYHQVQDDNGQSHPHRNHHHHQHYHHHRQNPECNTSTLTTSGRALELSVNSYTQTFVCESHKLLSYLELSKWMHRSTQSITSLRLEPSTMLATGRKHFFCMLASLLLLIGAISAHGLAWQRTGCHLLGHTQRVKISGCVEFEITTNACRGYCLSYSIPARDNDPARVPTQLVTSVAQCCSMIKSQEIKVRVMCVDGSRELRFRSATECSCSHCQKY